MGPEERLELGATLEGYAFTFCKAAFVAALLRRYTLLGTSSAAVALYLAASVLGVKEWRCWVKPPWVVLALAALALDEVRRLRRSQ